MKMDGIVAKPPTKEINGRNKNNNNNNNNNNNKDKNIYAFSQRKAFCTLISFSLLGIAVPKNT